MSSKKAASPGSGDAAWDGTVGGESGIPMFFEPVVGLHLGTKRIIQPIIGKVQGIFSTDFAFFVQPLKIHIQRVALVSDGAIRILGKLDH